MKRKTGKSMFQTKKEKTMKKLFLSLAALMMMTAPVMTSCSSEDLEEVAPVEEVKENVVTLTIKMSEQVETRVSVDENLKLTGWEENDVVKVYQFDYPVLSESVTFRCTDPSEGTFTGTLPAGKTLDDYNFAVYGRDAVFNTSISENYVVFPANEVRDNLKDCICLAGPIKNGSCTMSIYNNVIKVTNNGSPATGAWKQERQGIIKPYGMINDRSGYIPGHISKQSAFDEAKITIPSGVSYIFMPQMQGTIGFFDKDGKAIIPEKTINTAVVGKLYKVTIAGSTTGTAQRTGGIDVNWVQLWAGGPKFAEYNVGAANNKAEDYGGYYCWGGIVDKDPSEEPEYNSETTQLTGIDDTATKLWGTAWRMPTYEELQALLDNCGVEWTAVNGVNGKKFTGKGDYASNSVFLPAAGLSTSGYMEWEDEAGLYWSSTSERSGYACELAFDSSDQGVGGGRGRAYGHSVRAVLAE